ncbi:MAG: dTMP kinase [Sphingomonadaceae bacterium]
MSGRGRFITLEGVDGAGKSTHIDFLAQRLAALGRQPLVTREPGGTPLAEQLRVLVLAEPMAPLAETLLMFAARADHVEHVIRPALESGRWVLCDRFTDATAAYQGAGKGVSQELIQQLAEAVHPGLLPDRTLVFDCPFEVTRRRLAASGRSLDRFENEGAEFFNRVRKAYLTRAAAEPGRFRIIDATQTIANIQKQLEEALLVD